MSAQLAIADQSLDGADGEKARLHDPLWLLARQWQMGELNGEDAGSPIGARIETETAPIGPVQHGGPDSSAIDAYDAAHSPLEAAVEPEAWDTPDHAHVRVAVEAGLRLERRLRAGGLDEAANQLRAGFLFAAPSSTVEHRATARFLRVAHRRSTDGARLYRSLAPAVANGTLTMLPDVAPFSTITANRAAVIAALDEWMRDCRRLLGKGFTGTTPLGNAAGWQSQRLEYTFSVGARLAEDACALVDKEHVDGAVDWYSFDIDPTRTCGSPQASTRGTHSFLPVSVRFRGMPASRYWEFEDARVNLPKVAAARSSAATGMPDPATRLFLDFVVRYSNDWYSIPVRQAVGTVSRVVSLVVSNTFGERVALRHVNASQPHAPWQMFSMSVSDDVGAKADVAARVSEWFLLAPTVGAILQGPALEEVVFARDEMANLAWAIERKVESAAGQPVDRAEQYARSLDGSSPNPAPSVARYTLGTTVPNFWVPLLVSGMEPGATKMLVRGQVPDVRDGQIVGGLPPLGRILEPDKALSLYAEEVPPEGAVVTRRHRLARAADGTTWLWIGRAKGTWTGQASSSLRFDTVTMSSK